MPYILFCKRNTQSAIQNCAWAGTGLLGITWSVANVCKVSKSKIHTLASLGQFLGLRCSGKAGQGKSARGGGGGWGLGRQHGDMLEADQGRRRRERADWPEKGGGTGLAGIG